MPDMIRNKAKGRRPGVGAIFFCQRDGEGRALKLTETSGHTESVTASRHRRRIAVPKNSSKKAAAEKSIVTKSVEKKVNPRRTIG